nr:hypothetical protein [uncultured Hyphomonas sp.]
MTFIRRHIDVLVAGVSAILAVVLLDPNVLTSVTGELITFYGVQAAIILPAMVFTAGILKPEGLRFSEAEKYHKALRVQMMFWITLLVLDFVVVVSLIFGKAVSWNLVTPKWGFIPQLNWADAIMLVASFTGLLAVVRTIPFIRGVLSLLDMNSAMVLSAIKDRDASLANANRNAESAKIELPSGYGDKIVPNDGSSED